MESLEHSVQRRMGNWQDYKVDENGKEVGGKPSGICGLSNFTTRWDSARPDAMYNCF